MDTVSAKPLGKLGIVFNETSDPTRLDKIDKPANLDLINRRFAAAKQNAGRTAARERLGELSFKLRRRLCWKLQVEPASRLDFSHCRGLRRHFRINVEQGLSQIIWLAALSIAPGWNR
jgi:hypothetical protein